MIARTLQKKILEMAKKFPVVAVLGPRQSGKTTLARALFPGKPYVSLENRQTLDYAVQDPLGFLEEHRGGAILDEAQRAPELFSYLQTHVDLHPAEGPFILTGSQNFLLLEKISQSLAGRVRIFTLMPFSLSELLPTRKKTPVLEDLLIQGMYPRIYDKGVKPSDWYPDYIQTYLERDVRLIKNVHDLLSFHRFLRLCAGRTGSILNLSNLAADCGITHNTARAWLSVLETSYLVYLLAPHHRNFNKQIVRSPKLYFTDTGLTCSLLGIEQVSHLESHPLRGAIFETFIISELLKRRLHQGRTPQLYFWRDKTGHEVDCLTQQGADLIPVDIQAGKTINQESLKNLVYWRKLALQSQKPALLIYGGEEKQVRQGHVQILPWKALPQLPEEV